MAIRETSQILGDMFQFLALTEENMTQEDEQLMLDNFVTFFIAGEFVCFCCDAELWRKIRLERGQPS